MERGYVFDSYALLELLEDGPGAGIVADILASENNPVWLSYISLGEIYYILLRRVSGEKAKGIIETILPGERISLVDAGWARIKKAAEIKSGGGLSYADSFVLALGFEKGAAVVTGDREIIEQAEQLNIDILSI